MDPGFIKYFSQFENVNMNIQTRGAKSSWSNQLQDYFTIRQTNRQTGDKQGLFRQTDNGRQIGQAWLDIPVIWLEEDRKIPLVWLEEDRKIPMVWLEEDRKIPMIWEEEDRKISMAWFKERRKIQMFSLEEDRKMPMV